MGGFKENGNHDYAKLPVVVRLQIASQEIDTVCSITGEEETLSSILLQLSHYNLPLQTLVEEIDKQEGVKGHLLSFEINDAGERVINVIALDPEFDSKIYTMTSVRTFTAESWINAFRSALGMNPMEQRSGKEDQKKGRR